MAIGGEPQEYQDNMSRKLSSPRRYIPGGAEGSDSSQSSVVTEGEEIVEEGLAQFFDNPSYRAADPVLQRPVEPEEEDSPCANTYTNYSRTSTTNSKSNKKTTISTKEKGKEETG